MNSQAYDLNNSHPIDISQLYASFEIFELEFHLKTGR